MHRLIQFYTVALGIVVHIEEVKDFISFQSELRHVRTPKAINCHRRRINLSQKKLLKYD